MQCKAYSPYYIAVMERPSRHTVARHPGHDPVRVLVRRRSPPPVIAVSIASWPCTQCKSNAQLDTVGHHRNQCKSYAPYCRSHQTFVATHCQARRCWSSSCPSLHHSPVASRVHCSCRRPPVVLQTVQEMPLNRQTALHDDTVTLAGLSLSLSSDPRRETVRADVLVVILFVPSTTAGRLSLALLSASARCPVHVARNNAQ